MQSGTANFKKNVDHALADPDLQEALSHVRTGFINKRSQARARLSEFDEIREYARGIKDHTLGHLDLYLEHYERQVTEAGGTVHWAATAADAREIILNLCRERGAKTVTKGKSMVTEEIGLNDFLHSNGIRPIETDLGEYAIQLRGETPSHIIAPAIHLRQEQIETAFRENHQEFPPERNLESAAALLDEARQVLRQSYFDADIGITGANFLVAETGSSIIVTNEGNGDLTQTLPKTHIVVTSIEKIVPTLNDVAQILRLLARSATGQDMSVYTTFSTGPRRRQDVDGPSEYHVVLLDNGRSSMLGTEFQDVLRCIRCGACMNHCPVYHAIGGHAYGWVYPGPIGAVLTPGLTGLENSAHLPNASTFCGRCEEVCPMNIPLPKMMRHWREKEFEEHLTPRFSRYGIKLWAAIAKRPRIYKTLSAWARYALVCLAGGHGKIKYLPLASGWTRTRDFPAPAGGNFVEQWNAGHRRPAGLSGKSNGTDANRERKS